MAINKNYNEDSIVTLKPREAVRQAIGMYVGNAETGGMHHLAEEIICNAMDEAAAGYGKEVIVLVDSSKNQLTVKDDGRGIPFKKNSQGKYAIVEMCTSLHSGGKFESAGNYKSAIGLNGVGATVTNALSSYFKIESTRTVDNSSCILEFIEGEMKGPTFTELKIPTKSGSLVTFIPDVAVFKDVKWNKEKLLEMLQLHAVMNDNIRFTLIWDGVKTSFCYDNGIAEYLKIKSSDKKTITKPVVFKTKINGTEEVEIAFQYAEDGPERIYAFTNGAFNPDLGTHVTGFKTAFTNLINSKAKELKLLEENMANLDGNLLRRGLILVLSLKMAERPQFNEQQKLKLTSTSARTTVSQAVGKMLVPKGDLEAIIKKALVERKAEEAAQRKREAEKRVSSGGKVSFKDLPDKFSDAIQKGGGELFLVEGDSAAGSAKEARNKHTQAIFPLRGKPLNTFNKELADIIKNEEVKNVLTILGCGIGEKFNMKNLRYDKIIIMSDADPDGGHINCLLAALFMSHLPELIEAGKVYCALPPLYKITEGKRKTYTSDRSLVERSKGVITRLKGLGEMGADELWESTMNPETRELAQLTTDNFEDMMELFTILMGSDSSSRKKFIMENARKYSMFNADIGDESEVE